MRPGSAVSSGLEGPRTGRACAIVVSASTMGLAVARGLAREGVYVVAVRWDPRDIAQLSRSVGEVVSSPDPEQDEEGFVTVLTGLGERFPGAVVVTASDLAVLAVPRHAERLRAAGLLVAGPDAATAARFLDKAATVSIAVRAGVDVPFTRELHDRDDAAAFSAAASFPAVVKPHVSHLYLERFGAKWVLARDLPELIRHAETARAEGFAMLAQEYVPGDVYSGANYCAYVVDGEPCAEFTSMKIRNSPALTGSPCVVLSRRLPDVRDAGRRLLRAARYTGFANIEFKRDARDGVHRLIEVNARHNLSSMLAIRCGVNFPWCEYRHVARGERPALPEQLEGVYWIDITRDLRAARENRRETDGSWSRFVAPYRRPHVFAVWSVRDPGPAAARAFDTVRIVAGRLRPRTRGR